MIEPKSQTANTSEEISEKQQATEARVNLGTLSADIGFRMAQLGVNSMLRFLCFVLPLNRRAASKGFMLGLEECKAEIEKFGEGQEPSNMLKSDSHRSEAEILVFCCTGTWPEATAVQGIN